MVDAEKIWSSSHLPSLPTAAVRLLDLSKAAKVEIDDVVKIIKTDPALTARVLKATNSSFFGLRSQVISIDRAVPLLGTSVVISLALGFSLIDDSMTRGPLAEHYRRYWMQSVVHAATAELLSDITGIGCRSECFQAGLLLDIGQLAMLATVGTEYSHVLDAAAENQSELLDVESEMLGTNHCVIGVRLAENWNLPQSVRTVIAHHHVPLSTLLEFEHLPEFGPLKVAAMAASVGDYFCRPNKGPALRRMDNIADACFQMDGHQLEHYLERASAAIDESATMFNVSTDDLPAPSDLMAQANAQLSDLVLVAQMESAAASQREHAMEQERTVLQAKNEELKHQAFHDPLTKVYNRQYFDEALEREFALCRRTSGAMAVIFVDIDHFKQFNDTHGHLFGDLVLRHVGDRLKALLRGCDTLGRYGGEEFIVLVSQPYTDGLEILAERIRGAVAAEKIHSEGQEVSVTVSVGAAIAIPEKADGEDFKQNLIAAADEAMYASKKAGRNRCHMRSLLPSAASDAVVLIPRTDDCSAEQPVAG